MTKQPNDMIIEANMLSFNYPDGSRGLADCSLSIKSGSKTAVIGRNGAGKTTLFLHLNGILRPERGEIVFDGDPIDYSRAGLRKLRSRVGLVFQNPDSQLFSASVREDISFGPMNLGLEKPTVQQRVEEALEKTGMTQFADKPVHSLSFGQKKRVCIAGVLAMQPQLLILDEPLAGLDFRMQQELIETMEKLHSDGVTLLIATHDIDFAWEWGDNVRIMVDGGCDSSWDRDDICNDIRRFEQYGLGVPKTLELYQLMTSSGYIKNGVRPPINFKSLKEMIASPLYRCQDV